MIWNLRKIKNKNLLIPFFSVLFLSSCATGGDMSDMENRVIKCTKYVSSGQQLPEHIKNPITFVFSKENLKFSKSIPLSETAKKNRGMKEFSYDQSATDTFGFNSWGDLEMRLENQEKIKPASKEGISPSLSRVRDLNYQIFKASTKKDEYKGKWTLSEYLLENDGIAYDISLKGTLNCNLIKKS